MVWSGSSDERAPLVVLLHGRGSNETQMATVAQCVPAHLAAAALRGPVSLAPGQFTWFENRGIGRPVPESLRASLTWFGQWLAAVAPTRRVGLVGFSGGCAFAAGAVLDEPARYAGAALLYGTVPFDAGVPTTSDRLVGVRILHAQGRDDPVMPADLIRRTWEYVTTSSGAQLESYVTSGGHVIAPEVLIALSAWLESIFEE